jgi:hypothetical protein
MSCTHAALDYHETPAFMNALRDARRDRDGSLRVDNLALEFTILTAARTKEVRLAVWDEIYDAPESATFPRMFSSSARRF